MQEIILQPGSSVEIGGVKVTAAEIPGSQDSSESVRIQDIAAAVARIEGIVVTASLRSEVSG